MFFKIVHRGSLELKSDSDADFFAHFGDKIREMGRKSAKLNNMYLTQKLLKASDNHKGEHAAVLK